MFCIKCGAELPDSSNFCSSCGFRVLLGQGNDDPFSDLDENTKTDNSLFPKHKVNSKSKIGKRLNGIAREIEKREKGRTNGIIAMISFLDHIISEDNPNCKINNNFQGLSNNSMKFLINSLYSFDILREDLIFTKSFFSGITIKTTKEGREKIEDLYVSYISSPEFKAKMLIINQMNTNQLKNINNQIDMAGARMQAAVSQYEFVKRRRF